MFDAATGEAKGKVMIEGAVFPNDMTVWNGDVLVSDSGTATIHKVTPEGAAVFAHNAGWVGINGILGDGGRLLITTMTEGHLIAFRSAGSEEVIASGMIDADGIGLVPGGGYLVSSWPGEIHHVSEDGMVTLLVDTKPDGILQNDLSVFGDIVIVPNWEPGTVTAWRIVGE
jgi:sugar lactone lactonase YvrE